MHQHRYRIRRCLGAGGMGIVYEAVDLRLKRLVAIKMARHTMRKADALQQLDHEAAAMARVAGPHGCAVYDVTDWDGRPCLIMEHLQGSTLQARIAAGPLTAAEGLAIARQLAAALSAVHHAGLVHCDVKPSNVFIAGRGVVKLIDFGLAEAWPAKADKTPARGSGATSILGTSNYIAPERILRQGVDCRTDLFSLGAVIYEMTAGRPPFTGDSPAEVLFNVLQATPARLDDRRSGRAAAVAPVVRKLLAKSPANRFPSAAAVEQALAAIGPRLASDAAVTVSHLSKPGGHHHERFDCEPAAVVRRPVAGQSLRLAAMGAAAAAGSRPRPHGYL
jgi:serine/threonine-protein kinase